MKDRKFSFVHTGLSSLLVIFVVLSLVTFAVLSYVSALRDASLAQKSAQRTQLYYETDLLLRGQLTELDARLSALYEQLESKDEASFLAACSREFPDLKNNQLTLRQDFGEAQQLTAVLALTLPDKAGKPFYQICSWQVVTTKEWVPDDSLPVLQIQEGE